MTDSISIDILSLCNASRNMYGLRHQDYLRYRKYCTRRIHTLRKALGLQQGKKRFAKKPITADMVTSAKHLELLFINAERAWAHAMDLKRNHHDVHAAKVPSHKRHHASSRLQKAAEWADKLVEFSEGLQTKAYAETMHGYLAFDRAHYQEALDHFTVARTCYESLAQDGDATVSALAHAAVDSLDPSIRYCAYNLRIAKGDEIADIGKLMEMLRKGKPDDFLEGQLSNLLSKSLESKAQETRSIEWRNKSIPIKNAKLAQSIINAQEVGKVAPSSTDGETSFDQIISAWWDAQNVVDGLVREDGLAARTTTSSKSADNTEDLKWLQSFVSYSRIVATLDRNQAMIASVQDKLPVTQPASLTKGHSKYLAKKARQGGKITKKEDLGRLWDETIRTCDEMLELWGVEQDPALQAIWTCRRDLARAQRQLAATQGDKEVGVKLGYVQESLDLLDDTESHLNSAMKRASKQDLHSDASILARLLQQTYDLKQQARRERLALGTANVQSEPITVAEIPPKMEPIPCKPLLFDLAANEIDYRQASTGGGLRGWFGGLLGKK